MAGYPRLNIVERSYRLAKTGNYAGSAEIRRQLLAEGYGEEEIGAAFANPILTLTVVELCRHAQGKLEP